MKPVFPILRGIVRLTRFQEYLAFVVITTLLGVAVGHGTFGWRLVLVLVANWLAVGFAFMINDVEDAPDDALNPAKIGRNPVSSGDVSAPAGRAVSFVGAVLAALLYAPLGVWPLMAGIACLILGYLYSWRRIRLKVIPVLDLVSHGMMLAGLQFLAGYLAFAPSSVEQWVFPFVFLVAISLYGQMYNELRDLNGDLEAGLTHTAILLGPRLAHILMLALLTIGLASGVMTVLVVRLIPIWVLGLVGAMGAVLMLPRLRRLNRAQSVIEWQQPFQKPAEMAAAISLLVWFVGPWANSLLHVDGILLALLR